MAAGEPTPFPTQRLAAERRARGWTQHDVCLRGGITSQSVVSTAEAGAFPCARKLLQLALAFEVAPARMFEWVLETHLATRGAQLLPLYHQAQAAGGADGREPGRPPCTG